MKLLVIHPSNRAALRLRQALAGHGHVIDVCVDAQSAQPFAAAGSHDLILIKDDPPRHAAESALRVLQDLASTKRLVFGGDRGPDERARILRAGADDYLLEPFAMAEVLARIDALCRRQGGRASFEPHVALLDLELDLIRRQASRQGRPLGLTVQEFTLLAVFARHHGHVLTRSQLRDHLWGEQIESDSNLVEVAVRRLRSKLDRHFEPKLLHTVRGAGYVLDERAGG